MARKPRKAAPPLQNLCLDIPLTRAPAPYLIGVDPAAKDPQSWGMAISPATAPPTPPLAVAATQQAIDWKSVTAGLDWAKTADTMAKYKDAIASITQAQMNSLFQTNILGAPYGGRHEGRFEPTRAEDLGCVAAMVQAVRDHYRGEGLSLDYCVKDWRDEDPRYLNAWLFGPRGEFTGFARVDALKDEMTQHARQGRRGDVVVAKPRGLPIPVSFRITLLMGIQDAMWRKSVHGVGEPQAYYQFATYEDYAAWESLATYDRTSLDDL
ncbi:hypothetical protein MARCHEWKA_04710 [Brevundimonas phage vB_BpoS-Marchewka]|uniref:Uncharacterized protein n=1 Tax=Brevundimonas phage vB_BpoS-Marchewka TaxID=2948604 RepID=A0A9E7SR09_9CAUD|nr:hypothetical protein MARCHEWKA_04710 [Brevundimonas phage vB_BpoS-Marchewka]